MRHNEERIAHFTSSQIYRLVVGSKTVRDNYIQEKIIEKRLGKSLESGGGGQAAYWGIFMEMVVFELLGLEYKIESKLTDLHPTLGDVWSGSKDLIVPGVKVGDIKAYQYKKFAQYAECLKRGSVEFFRSEFPQEYWQLVSNAAIHNVSIGEAILYMPYESEIPEIKKLAEAYDGPDMWKYKFIAESEIQDLPSLKDGGYYQNVNTFEFEIPKADTELLTAAVETYGKILRAA